MVKVYKATVYFTDIYEDLAGEDDYKDMLEQQIGSAGLADCYDVSSSNEFDWNDEIDLNQTVITKDTYEKYLLIK